MVWQIRSASVKYGKVQFALQTRYSYSANESLGLCHFVFGTSWQLFGPQHKADLMAAATGWDVTLAELQALGRRRVNLMRAFNAREGLTRAEDTLPEKLFKNPLQGGRSDGLLIEREELADGLRLYYHAAGWEAETGMPTRTTLEEVGLAWVADALGI
ncbi:MAG: hypothetical protein IPO34_20820 [Dehalococcoidia bacterium]|nr:hypothetical protein [Dehalococcoidia bacterium]